MLIKSPASEETGFSKEAIYQQIERIFTDSFFLNSDILKRFLVFIVDETMLGNSNLLKEYTIGIKVLNKPINFKPQENGIVRIHAGRLRRALNHYYNAQGAQDTLRIYVPKGSYVPFFCNPNDKTIDDAFINTNKSHINASPAIAVLPFGHLNDHAIENSLADGLGFQLTTELMMFEEISVIAYYTARELCKKNEDITTLINVQYIVTGNIQIQDDRLRIYVQFVEVQTNQQLWSRKYERKCTTTEIFELEDEITHLIVAEIEEELSLTKAKNAVIASRKAVV